MKTPEGGREGGGFQRKAPDRQLCSLVNSRSRAVLFFLMGMGWGETCWLKAC